MDSDLAWRKYAKPNPIAFNGYDFNNDVAANDDAFVVAAGKN
jgi:hypothetical protein